jgi:hypothetical protein
MNRPQHKIGLAASVLVFAAFLAAHSAAAPPARKPAPAPEHQESANQLVRDVIYNENQAEIDDQSCWRYRELDTEAGKTLLFDVFGTRYGDVQRLLAINYEPLDAAQRRKEDARLEKLLKNPQAIRKARQDGHEDAERARSLMDMLPDAFVYKYDGSAGDKVRLRFRPNPDFRPPTREAQVFHHMAGTMWIDRKQRRLAAIEGRLTSEVKFGYGLLGHLNAGGTFYVKEADEGDGHWQMTWLDVEMSGRAVFFKTIGVQEKQLYFDFEQIPEDMTLMQAVSQLEEDDGASVEHALADSQRP